MPQFVNLLGGGQTAYYTEKLKLVAYSGNQVNALTQIQIIPEAHRPPLTFRTFAGELEGCGAFRGRSFHVFMCTVKSERLNLMPGEQSLKPPLSRWPTQALNTVAPFLKDPGL